MAGNHHRPRPHHTRIAHRAVLNHLHDRSQWSDGSIDTVTLQLWQIDTLIMGELFALGGPALIALIGCAVHLGQRRLATPVAENREVTEITEAAEARTG